MEPFGMSESYKDRFFDQLVKTVDRIEDKVDANTKLTQEVKTQAENTNGRVDQLEIQISKVKGKPINPKNLTSWYKDPTIIKIGLYLSLALLLLVAGAVGTDIGQLL